MKALALCRMLLLLALPVVRISAEAQISLTSAVDLALRNSPRVQAAEAEVEGARFALKETRDIFIPSVVAGSGLGYSYGFPVGQPSIYNFNAQSLVFNFSQRDYIRAARLGLEAANYALMDARSATAEETALAYLALDHDQRRAEVLKDQVAASARTVTIVIERQDAGFDTAMDLTIAKLGDANIRLAQLRNVNGMEYDRARLSRLTGLPADGLGTVSMSVPPVSSWIKPVFLPGALNSPGVLAAYSRAQSRQEQALGDARAERRPQVSFGASYNRFASFNNYEYYFNHFQHNNAAIGFQLSLPIIDLVRRDRARESAAEAVRTYREADQQRNQFSEARLRLRQVAAETELRFEVATLDQQLAQQQLDAMLIQVRVGNGNPQAHPANPKDEQTARIAAADRSIILLNTTLDLQQTQISLLRQTGQLEPWLKELAAGMLPVP